MVKVTKKSPLIVTTHVMAVIYTSASFHWNKINIFLIIMRFHGSVAASNFQPRNKSQLLDRYSSVVFIEKATTS
jgi:hypothetical protein